MSRIKKCAKRAGLEKGAHAHAWVQGCNWAHVLGLYKMTGGAGRALSVTGRGALADMALWAIFRLQTRLFASNTYAKCVTAPYYHTQFSNTCHPEALPLSAVNCPEHAWGRGRERQTTLLYLTSFWHIPFHLSCRAAG